MNYEKLKEILREEDGNDLLEQLYEFGGEVEVIRALVERADRWQRAAECLYFPEEMPNHEGDALMDHARELDNG